MRWLLLSVLLALALLAHAQEQPKQQRGREFYAEQACWQCHVQARDRGFPALTGTRRTGPVLDEVRWPRSREWHLAHFYAPRAVMAGSAMPAYPREFTPHENAAAVEALIVRHDRDGDGVVTRNEYGGKDFPEGLDHGDGVLSRADAPPQAGADLDGLVAYLAGIDGSMPQVAAPPRKAKPKDAARSIARGDKLFGRHCAGCHGERADGNGRVAAFFHDHPPRNFLRGEFKFRSTMAPDPPLDRDLFGTIRGGAGPSMPAWPQLGDREVWDLVEFVKSNHPSYLPRELFVDGADLEFVRDGDTDDASGADLDGGRILKRAGKWFWITEGGEQLITDGMRAGELTFRLGKAVYDWMEGLEPRPVLIAVPPLRFTPKSAAIGRAVYEEFGCAECHGARGKGDGENAGKARGSLGRIVLPTDYTRGPRWLKGGADAYSLVRAFMTGLHGTPMPAYKANFAAAKAAPPARAPWHLAHFIMRQAGMPFDR